MIDRLLTGLANGAGPSLDAVLRRTLAFNGETRLRILEKQEGGRAREQITRHGSDGLPRARLQVCGDEALQRFGVEHTADKMPACRADCS